MKCPKCGAELTTCLCCGAKTLCRPCKACFGYKPAPRDPQLNLRGAPMPPLSMPTKQKVIQC